MTPIDELVAWLRASGATIDRLAVRPAHTDGERAVHAHASIPRGAEVIAIPLANIITRPLAEASPIGRAIAGAGLDLRSDHSILAAYLLEERAAPGSRWRPYLRALPRAYPHLPVHFTRAELAWLEGSFTLRKIARMRAALRDEHADLCARVPGFARHSLADFVWARLSVVTRVFTLELDGERTIGLVPFVDLLNHAAPRQTAWGMELGGDRFVVTVLRDFAPGDEVHDSYGGKCNGRYFVHYGFCLDDNPDNQAAIRLPALPPLAGPALARARDLLGDGAAVPAVFHVPASYRDPQVQRLFSLLRIVCADDAEAARLPRLPGGLIPPQSIDNEAAVLAALDVATRRALALFPTSREEDDHLLATATLTRNQRNAVVMRRGEKRVLATFQALAAGRPTNSPLWSEYRSDLAAHPPRAG